MLLVKCPVETDQHLGNILLHFSVKQTGRKLIIGAPNLQENKSANFRLLCIFQ